MTSTGFDGAPGTRPGRASPRARPARPLGPAPNRVAAIVWAVVLGTMLPMAAIESVRAASAAPSASAGTDAGAYPNLEAWVDQAPPPDAPAGSTILVGLTIWDSHQAQLFEMNGLYLKLHPATGKARPTEAVTRSDWPGHLLANVIVPKGGPGNVELVVRDQTCTADGTCGPADLPIHVGGVGPPPDAPLSSLVSAIVHLPAEPAVAGRPMDVVVDVTPRAEWDPSTLGVPDRLVVIATLGRGPDLANTVIRRQNGPNAPYRGQITIPEPGDVALVIAFPGHGGADDVIQSATTRVKVGASGPSTAPAAIAPPVEDGPSWPLVGGGLALVVVTGFVIRRVFADL